MLQLGAAGDPRVWSSRAGGSEGASCQRLVSVRSRLLAGRHARFLPIGCEVVFENVKDSTPDCGLDASDADPTIHLKKKIFSCTVEVHT